GRKLRRKLASVSDDDGRRGRDPLDRVEELDPRVVRNLGAADHEVRAVPGDLLQRVGAERAARDAVALPLEVEGQRGRRVHVGIDDQDPGPAIAHLLLLPSTSLRVGNATSWNALFT